MVNLIDTKVLGPTNTVSEGGSRYMLSFVDYFSRLVVAFFIKHKSETAYKLSESKAFFESRWGGRLKCFDQTTGRKNMSKICARSGIRHQLTVSYSS